MQPAVVLYLVDTMFGNRFWFPLFQRAHALAGYKVDAVCFHRYQRGVFTPLECIRKVYPEPEFIHAYTSLPDHPDPELQGWAEDLEDSIDCLLIDLIQADRHLGLGFQNAGLNNPGTAVRKRSSYWRTLRYIRQLDGYVEQMLDQSAPSVVVTSVVADLYSKLICAKARARGIPVRLFNSLQVASLYGWYHDEYWTHPPLKQRLEQKLSAAGTAAQALKLEKGPPSNANVAREPIYATHYLRQLKASLGFRALAKSLAKEALRSIGHMKTRRPDRAGFLQAARLQIRVRRQYAELARRVRHQSETLPERFVLYALHKEPEASTMVKAPEFNHQLAIIDLIARSLPAGYKLLVKESMVSLGFRSEGFYQAVSELPNTHLVMPDLRASDLLPQAAAVIAITGTIGLEAARAGIPVISFGTRNNYAAIEHVHTVNDLFGIRELLAELLRKVPAEVQRQRTARSLFYDEAAAEVGVDIGEFFEAKRGSLSPVDPRVIEESTDLLLASLPEPQLDRRISQ